MKALTFEEWWLQPTTDINPSEKCIAEYAWNAGRVGMVPEDEAVWIDWEEHHGCTGARIIYEYGPFGTVVWNSGGEEMKATLVTSGNSYVKTGEYIRRPAPAWTPKVGDTVFYRHTGNNVGVGVIESIKDYGKTAYYMKGSRDTGWYEVKPFDATKIGKPWEEI